jgi:hypothetical protein
MQFISPPLSVTILLAAFATAAPASGEFELHSTPRSAWRRFAWF